jgi:hypothetical protein
MPSGPQRDSDRRGVGYAGVIATLALLLAAVALVAAITGADRKTETVTAQTPPPRPQNLTGAQIDESTLGPVPRARTASDAARLEGKRASAFVPAGRVRSSGLVKLSRGETKTVLRASPFVFRARCDEAGGKARVNLLARAPKDSIVTIASKPAAAFKTTREAPLANITGAHVWISGQPLTATAPKGGSAAGLLSFGADIFGADCAVSIVLTS